MFTIFHASTGRSIHRNYDGPSSPTKKAGVQMTVTGTIERGITPSQPCR